MQEKNIYICATMDTKGEEAMYLKQQIEACGNRAYIIDIALRATPKQYSVDYTQEQVAAGAMVPFSTVLETSLRSEASKYMVTGLTVLIKHLLAEGKLDGIISLGGSGGTTIATGAMQQLPMGIPKVAIGTMASGNTLPYVQGQDILLINSVVDIQSLNFMSTYILTEAAHIIDCMARMPKLALNKKKCIAITCFGVTTPCVQRCRELLEEMGFEILIFHARGVSGGKIMEKMIEEGNQKAAVVYEAMAYQVAKSIAAMTIPLKGKVDAIILTGGAAHSKKLTGMIQEYAGHLGEFILMPGENELEALAEGAWRILEGKEEVNTYQG